MTEKQKRLRFLENFKEVMANNMTKAGFIIVSLFFMSAIFAPWLAPYAPHKQDFSVALKKPNLKYKI